MEAAKRKAIFEQIRLVCRVLQLEPNLILKMERLMLNEKMP
jgi:hypothetical protein